MSDDSFRIFPPTITMARYEAVVNDLTTTIADLRADLEAATETITAQAEVLRHTRDALTAALHKWADEQDPACPQRTETP